MRRRLAAVMSIVFGLISACRVLALPVSSPTALVSPSPSPTPYAEPGASADSGSGPSTGCYYTWSTRELPSVGAQLEALLAESGRGSQVSAYAFGEECRSDAGETAFLAMETDFRLRVPVDSLENEEAMGNTIQAAMAAIEALPDDQLVGTRPGRAEFEFTAAGSPSLHLNVEISRFQKEAAILQGAALFRYFKDTP